MASRPHFLAAWEKKTVPSPGGGSVQIYVRPCRMCGGTYVWQYGCKTRTCATGTVIKSFFYGIKNSKSFCKRFLSSSLTTFFCIDGVGANKGAFEDQLQAKAAAKAPPPPPPKDPPPSEPETSRKKKRKYTEESQLWFKHLFTVIQSVVFWYEMQCFW